MKRPSRISSGREEGEAAKPSNKSVKGLLGGGRKRRPRRAIHPPRIPSGTGGREGGPAEQCIVFARGREMSGTGSGEHKGWDDCTVVWSCLSLVFCHLPSCPSLPGLSGSVTGSRTECGRATCCHGSRTPPITNQAKLSFSPLLAQRRRNQPSIRISKSRIYARNEPNAPILMCSVSQSITYAPAIPVSPTPPQGRMSRVTGHVRCPAPACLRVAGAV